MDDKRDVFNEQMNEWVSRQGLWFQLRHAADGQSIISRLARLGLRLLILLIICALIFWVYLVRRVGKPDFKEGVRASIEETLRGSKCVVGSIRKDRDIATISHIEMEGTDKSFFHHVNASILRLNMKLTDGFVGVWNGGGISIDRLDVDLKGGASSDAAAAEAYQALFAEHGSFKFDWLEVQKTNLVWGYSSNNRGAIWGSRMTASRDEDTWKLEFKGGTFSQNWLRHYEIGKMIVVCDRQGVHIQEAELLADGGSLTFQVEVGAGGQPEASGSVVINSMPMKSLLPFRFSEWVEGRISGKGTVSGSTNSQEGIALDLHLSIVRLGLQGR